MKLPSALLVTLSILTISAIPFEGNSVIAQETNTIDTITIDYNWATNRVIELDVTPMGVVLDFGNSPISAVDLSHLREIIFRGMDGVLCPPQAECPDGAPPTKLLLRKISPIPFENEKPSPDGTTMLYVSTASGIYRFQLQPVEKLNNYTKVNIETAPETALPGLPLQ